MNGFSAPRRGCLSLYVAIACLLSTHGAQAQTQGLGLSLEPDTIDNFISATQFANGQLNTWYQVQSDAMVAVGVDSNPETLRYITKEDSLWDQEAFVDMHVEPAGLVSVSTAGRTGSSATSSIFGGYDRLGAYSRSTDATIQSTLSAAHNVVVGRYVLLSDQPGYINLALNLRGRLSVASTTSHKHNAAGVAFLGLGSSPSSGPEESYPFSAWYGAPGADAYAPDAVSFRSPNFVVSSYHAGGVLEGNLDVDEDILLRADGLPFPCVQGVAGAEMFCGKYLYAFHLMLNTGAENNAEADFMHGLKFVSLVVPEGMDVQFASGEHLMVSSVPEPQAWSLALGGLVLAGAAGWRRRPIAV